MFHKILVAMDTSAISQQVFIEALSLAKATESSLMLLHVLSPEEEGSPNMPIYSSVEYYPPVSRASMDLYRQRWETFESQCLELLRLRKNEATLVGVSVEFNQSPGNPGRTICNSARAWGADLIIIGRQGHSGLDELTLGSVSNYVLHHAPCSVLAAQCPAKNSTRQSVRNQSSKAAILN